MKDSRALLTSVCLVACLSVAASALAGTTNASTTKPAGTPAAKSSAPAHHTASSTGSVTATVVSVDQATRKVTLKGENGAEYSFTAEPSVKNLAQVKPGDIVTATYTESIGYVVKSGGQAGMAASTAGSTAPAGEKPAATETNKMTVTVVVTAIDAAAQTVTVKGPQGNSHTVKVQDPANLEGVKVGDSVDITYTEVMAIKVHTPQAAPKKK